MIITHCPLPALSKSRLNFGLQSFLLLPDRLKANISSKIRPSQYQWFRFLLNRFYPGQDGFSAWNRISDFQRTKNLYATLVAEGEHRTNVRTPYILGLNAEVLRRV